ncbi:MAG: epimerase [Aeromicrobium sp.]|nr:epimerase [Aeromicrobium sp.]
MSRVVLVTGVAGPFASMYARRLAALGEDGGIDRVVGIDTTLPDADLGGVKFVRADIRTPVIGKVIAVEDVDTVGHLDVNPPMRGRISG